MKKLFLVLLLIVMGGAGYIFSKPDNRWMLLNYYQADAHAKKLLAGDLVPPPTWAVDMVISNNSQQRLVMFSDKKHQRVYAYSPHKWPEISKLQWRKVWDSWYVSL